MPVMLCWSIAEYSLCVLTFEVDHVGSWRITVQVFGSVVWQLGRLLPVHRPDFNFLVILTNIY